MHSYSGLTIARTLGRLGIAVFGVHHEVHVPAMASRYVRDIHKWNIDALSAQDSVTFLLSLAQRLDNRPVLFPTDDEGSIFIAQNAEALKRGFRFPYCSPSRLVTLTDKQQLHELCGEVGIPSPRTLALPESRDEIATFAQSATFPVMVKALAQWVRFPRINTEIAKSPADLIAAYDRMRGKECPRILLQEYIGDAEAGWTCGGYFDARSELLGIYTNRKVRDFPVDAGATTFGVSVHNPVLEEHIQRLATAVEYHGAIHMDFRYDRRDGLYKLLDVNPRLGAGFRHFVDEDGLDMARLLYLDVTGQPRRAGHAPHGRTRLVETDDIASAAKRIGDGSLTVRAWLRSLRSVDEMTYWARDDPRPFAAATWKFGRWAAGRAWRRRPRPGGATTASEPGRALPQRDWLLLLFLAVHSAPRGMEVTSVRQAMSVLGKEADLPASVAHAFAESGATQIRADIDALISAGWVEHCPGDVDARFRATSSGVKRAMALVDEAAAVAPRAVQRLYDFKRDWPVDVAAVSLAGNTGPYPAPPARTGPLDLLGRWVWKFARLLARIVLDRGLDTADVAVEAHHFHPDRVRYRASGWTWLGRVLDCLDIGPSDVFVDFGSGKGRVVYQAASYPFRRIVGVEISAELNRIAQANVDHKRHKLACGDIELITEDMVKFSVPDDMTIAYFFIPVTGVLFERTIDNIISSLDRRPRAVKIVYVYPFSHPRADDAERYINSTGRFHATPETLRNEFDDDENRVAVYVSSSSGG